MEWVTTTGRSLAEAKERALDQLGVAEDDAEFEILDEPRPGLFGRVRGEARVRARVRPTQPRPKMDRRDRKRSKRHEADGAGDGTTSTSEPEAPAASEGTPRAARTPRAAGPRRGADTESASSAPGGSSPTRPARKAVSAPAAAAVADAPAGDQAIDAPAAEEDGTAETVDDTTSTAGNRSKRRRRGGRGRGARPRSDGADGDSADGDDLNDDVSDDIETTRDRAGTNQQEDPVDAQQVGEEARSFVQGLVDAFGLQGTASLQVEGDDLEVAVAGSDLGLLVGPRGTTLQAVQELARVAAQRRHGDHDTRLRVDVGGYRVRRREALTRFALEQAAQVVAEGTARALEPMSSSDRKVIHDALSSHEGVATRSEGDDPMRRVVIAPARD